MDVTIVRPEKSFTQTAGDIAQSLIEVAASSFVVMLALGTFHHDVSPLVPALGYWHTLIGVYAIRCLTSSDYLVWTRSE